MTAPEKVTIKFDATGGEAGFYDPNDNSIHMNPMAPGFMSGFSDSYSTIVDTISHKTTHAWQQELIDGYKTGSISPSDPNYITARILVVNQKIYQQSPENLSSQDEKAQKEISDYKNQPNERQAYRIGSRVGPTIRATPHLVR